VLEIKYEDRVALVERLQNLSLKAPDVAGFFQGLVKNAEFSGDLIADGIAGYVGQPKGDASHLVDWARIIDTNPVDKNKALGTILLPLLSGGTGLEDRTFFAAMIVRYRLVRSQPVIDDLRARYQVPERAAPAAKAQDAAPIITGPPVEWAGETQALELQGWFTPDPQLLDLETVLTAAKRARAVCRVEVTANSMGTGMLIGPDLVLTNFHVMSKKDMAAAPAVLEANARNTVLRFGAFTAKGPAAAGQEVRLSAQAVVASSAKYDFALLRTDDSIARAADVEAFSELGVMPVKTNPLYVLQHPGGGAMKLALSSQGVTWIDPGRVTIEYTTNVALGSSGSPCFDADWKLVALHHAGEGAKGQGILMESIFEQVKQHLHA
jgi:V8-like Glu-specific endopeptidase